MYVIEMRFECFENTSIPRVEGVVNPLLEALRYNGQILGREFPIIMDEGFFTVRVIVAETQSLAASFHSEQVKQQLLRLSDGGLLSPKLKLIGRDINSDTCTENFSPDWQILYTTYVHSCSPLRCGDSFMPIPLYRIPPTSDTDHYDLIRWQTHWQAYDEIQMAGNLEAESAALREMHDLISPLFIKGLLLREKIETLTRIPTFYYQYRVGGESLEQEERRMCPRCGGKWRLDKPLHDIFHFKCNQCRLVSNLSWDFA